MRTRLASIVATSLLSFSALAHADTQIGASADADDGPKNSITFNPLEELVGLINVSYERAVTPRASVQIDLMGASASGTNDQGNQASVGFFSATVQPHFYFGKRSLEGAYIAPFLQVAALDAADSSGAGGTVSLVSSGATVGYSWLAGPVNIKLGAGPKVSMGSALAIDSKGNAERASGWGVGLTMDLSMGVAF
ncbi:MAG TPA: hypothetical protein VL463_32315 [Kofleriaceae bacterium]|nr:hypothetical protein [Kofleriaceae bacterium]